MRAIEQRQVAGSAMLNSQNGTEWTLKFPMADTKKEC